ncbi:glycosyltransferase family 2 protein [Maribacter sp. CXY002]|uniref:glycosyltransferase family 2 protein n=1 Tax=Maribacter luteocoastalis TaxID=3407671 RepID=UPI003B66F7E8
MKVSLITGTYNSAEFINDCVTSINNQDYLDIEHVIIDGASKDETVDIIKNTPNRVTKLISEPDEGIYDAMNKGIKNTSGDIVGILNSDDFYDSNDVISKVVDTFKRENVDCVFGNLYYVLQQDTSVIKRKWVTGGYNAKKGFKNGWHPAHPSFFVKKELYDNFGLFDTSFKIAADFELMLRFIEKHKAKTAYINEPFVRMRLGGESNRSLSNIVQGNKECIRAFKKNGIPVSKLYPLIRLAPKLKQFINH